MQTCDTFMPGFSKVRNSLERFMTVKTRHMFTSTRHSTIGRLSKKVMGEQNGLCPIEEVFSMSSVDPGRINEVGCREEELSDQTQSGLDCFGNKIDIQTKGGNAHDPLCGSSWCGEFALGVDAYKPTFYSYERRTPTVCIDASMTKPGEVKSTLMAIKTDAPKLIISDLDYLVWDLVMKRGPGNTSIAADVCFGRDVGLNSGQFPFLPQSYLNHEFIKRIQEIVLLDPDNFGKRFTVEASHHQIQKAIEDDQLQKGIERRTLDSVKDPWRAEPTLTYDGIRYIAKVMPDYVGVIDKGTHCTFIRPRRHTHQAGNVHGTVARPNYTLSQGCTISCAGRTLDKYEVLQWYIEDSVQYVPFIAKGNVPTSGREEISDNVYASPTAFKTYWVKDHAVTVPDGCSNDRGQFQQMGQRVVFGLFNRPDKIDHGSILAQPVHRSIELVKNCCPDKAGKPKVKPLEREDDGCEERVSGCKEPGCEGSASTEGNGGELPDDPASPGGVLSSPYGIRVERIEGIDTFARVCITRKKGDAGPASINYVTQDVTAVAGTNYTAATGTLNWADQERGEKCVDIPIADAGIAAPVDFNVVFGSTAGATPDPALNAVNVVINPMS